MKSSLLSRRQFLESAAATAALAAADPLHSLAQSASAADGAPQGANGMPHVHVRVGGAPPDAAPVPQDFIGLSYETMQLEDPTFFSAKNVGLVQQFRHLSPRGVLRVGGNTSEFGWWKSKPSDTPPERVMRWHKSGEPGPTTVFAVTPETVRELRSFLDATGWTCIYGLNLGFAILEKDVEEAKFVFETLGPKLQYFQLGNEVDLFKGHLRDPETWNVNTYLEDWLPIARAVQKAVPGATFGMPDVASDVDWLTAIADKWPTLSDAPHVTTLSHHYYWSGPPQSPKVTAEALLEGDPKVAHQGEVARAAAQKMHVRYRMTEGNTVYQGGKPGVSDAYASALWSADYLLHLMQMGYCGVNLHGGSGHAQAVSVGGFLRGEQIMKDPNAPHPKPFYTPIANKATLAGSGVDGKLGPDYVLEPVGYGMKFTVPFVGCTMVPVTVTSAGPEGTPTELTAYAGKRADGRTMVAVLNKNPNADVTITAPEFETLQVLTGPSIEANEASLTTVVRENSSRRGPDGQTFVLPRHSATLILLR